MPHITIQFRDHVHSVVSSDDIGIMYEMSEYFTFMVPNAQFTPQYKNRVWDGKIRLYNKASGEIYAGILHHVIRFADERKYTVSLQNFPKLTQKIDDEELGIFLKDLNLHCGGKKIVPYEHQLKAIRSALKNKRRTLLAPTASGKSLIIYCLMRYLLEKRPKTKKLLLVPDVGLIFQMRSDFKDYSSENGWEVDDYVHSIYEGQDKDSDCPIFFSTWQSLYKMPKEYFEQFGEIIVDEAHKAKAVCIKSIGEKCINCDYRIGLTGTLDGTECNRFLIEGILGPVETIVKTRTLMDRNLIAGLNIECLVLKYTGEECKRAKTMNYQEEIQFLVSHEKRNNFIGDLALSCKGNTIILVQYVKNHAVKLYEQIKKKAEGTGRNVYYYTGEVDVEEREEIRKIVDNETGSIIVANYQVMSHGINIKRIFNIIFAHPSKGNIRVIQSIGRSLRLAHDKDNATLYDISDDLRYGQKENASYRHLLDRLRIYDGEQHTYMQRYLTL